MKMRMKGRVFYFKLMAAFLLVVLLYTFAATGVYFYKNNEITQIDQDSQHQLFMEQTRDQIDIRLNVGYNLINQLKNNEFIKKYGETSEEDYYLVTRSLNELMKYVDGFSDFGYRVDIMKPGFPVVITPNETVSSARYFKDLGIINQSAEDMEEILHRTEGLAPFILQDAANAEATMSYNHFITLVRKVRLANSSELYFLLSLYEKYLLPPVSDDIEEGFAILNRQGFVTFKSGMDEHAVDKIFTPDLLDSIHKTTESYQKIYQENHVIHVMRSRQLTDWKYIYITPKNIIQTKMRGTLIQSLKVYIALIFAGSLLALLIAHNTYKPVRNIVNIFRGYEDDGESPSGRDEFSYIRESASKIRKDNMQLTKKIQDYKIPLKNKFIRDLIYGIVPSEQAVTISAELGLNKFNGEMSVVLMEYVHYSKLENALSQEELSQIKKEIYQTVEEMLASALSCEVFELSYKRIGIILQEAGLHSIAKILNNIIFEISRKYDVQMFASVGKPVVSIQNIKDSYLDALHVIEEKFALDKRTVIMYNELVNHGKSLYYYPMDLERDLIHQMIMGKSDEVNAALYNILQTNLIGRSLGKEVLSQFIFAIVSTINRILQSLDASAAEVFGDDVSIYAVLKESENEKHLKQNIEFLFAMLLKKVKIKNSEVDHTIAEQMLSYIHDNYHMDISLTDLSEHFHLSPGYVSLLFKNYIKSNFKDYLNMYRVNQAKQLLKQQQIKIGEVAAKVGCNNANTFIRIFKKYEGISPGQYTKATEQES